HLDLVVLAQALDVRRREAAGGDIDAALLHLELHVRLVLEVLEVDRAGLRGAEDTLVAVICLELHELVELVARDRVRACESLVLDDVGVARDRVGRERLLVDDRAGGARQDLWPDLVVRVLEVEYDRRGIGRLGAVEVAEQARRTVVCGDLELAIEAELDVGGGQLVAVCKLQALLQLDRVLGRGGVLRRGGDVGLDLSAAGLRVHEEREDVVHDEERAVVVRAGRVEGRHLVGGADDERATRGGVVVRTAACGASGQDECRDGDPSQYGKRALTNGGCGCHICLSDGCEEHHGSRIFASRVLLYVSLVTHIRHAERIPRDSVVQCLRAPERATVGLCCTTPRANAWIRRGRGRCVAGGGRVTPSGGRGVLSRYGRVRAGSRGISLVRQRHPFVEVCPACRPCCAGGRG